MIRDEFKVRYTTIPFATFNGDYKKQVGKKDTVTLFHKHREMELMTILEGKAELCVGMESFEVEKGDVVIISPYLLHNATIYANCDFKHYCLCFDMDIINDKNLKSSLENGLYSISPVIKSTESISAKLSAFLQKSYECHSSRCKGWELQVMGNLSCFFGLLFENGYIDMRDNAVLNNDICCKVFDYIENNYSRQITLDEVAKLFYVSKSYFCRVFKHNFGKTFNNYVCIYRIEKACVFLKNTNLSVSEISLKVGFNSFSFFDKMFKRYIGVSPMDYRKIHTV